MSLQPQQFPNIDAARAAAFDAMSAASNAGGRGVLLVRTFDDVLQTRRLLAQKNQGFGCTVSTVAAWTEDLWALYGDGSTLVGRTDRELLVHALLDSGAFALPATDGIADFICRTVSKLAPYLGNQAALSENEAVAIEVARAYIQQLEQINMTEACIAQVQLTAMPELHRYTPCVVDVPLCDLTPSELQLLEAAHASVLEDALQQPAACAARSEELASLQSLLFRRRATTPPVTPTGALRFAFAAGPTASNRSIALTIDHLLQADAEMHIVVTAKDPRGCFNFCAPRLQQAGCSTRLQTNVRFADTDMGRALLNLADMTSGRPVDKMQAADFMLSPFSGMSASVAFYSDRMNRKNRLATDDEVLTDVAGHANAMLQGVISLLERNSYNDAFDALQAFLNLRFARQAAYCAEQSRAIALARESCSAAQRFSIPWHRAVALLAQRSLSIDAATANDAQVTFMTLDDAAKLQPASVDAVVVGDLNFTDYPVLPAADAVRTLMAKLNISASDDPLGQARRVFYRALQAARTTVVLQRTLNNAEAKPLPAATMFVEAIDCYRIDATKNADMDKALGITQNLVPFALQAGEQNLIENAIDQPQRPLEPVTVPSIGTISDEAREFIVLPRICKGKRVFEGLNLSASQIESYLECPYQWFAKRRLKLEAIDEGFGAAERGSFIHEVLQSFYLSFQRSVGQKVTADTLDEAHVVMSDAFGDVARRQFEKSLQSGSRYVPIDAWEQQVRDSILPRLQDYLPFEATLLPRFTPIKFEWGYGDLEPYVYAGCKICGRIDRIDADGRGNAVVIDYKSSLGTAYRLHDANNPTAEFELPRKMQALIYAKAVQDLLHLNVVGTLYLNPITHEVQGAIDANYVGEHDVPFAKKADFEAARVPFSGMNSFADLMESSEELVRERMAQLAKGIIDPRPLSKESCKYCPARLCTQRLQEREA